MRNFFIILIIIVVIIAVVLINKRSKEINQNIDGAIQTDTQVPTQDNSISVNPSVDVAVNPIVSVSQINVTVNGGNFYFKPNIIKVKQGDTVNVTFVNDDGVHDFKIDEFKVAANQLKVGEQEVITFVADKKGSFEYYCSVGSHRQMGMKGTLIVE